MEIHEVPIAKTEMLIRKPVSEVFVNPAITSNSGSPKDGFARLCRPCGRPSASGRIGYYFGAPPQIRGGAPSK